MLFSAFSADFLCVLCDLRFYSGLGTLKPPSSPLSTPHTRIHLALTSVPAARLSHTAPAVAQDEISLPAFCAGIPGCAVAYPVQPGQPAQMVPSDDSTPASAPYRCPRPSPRLPATCKRPRSRS